MPKEDKIALDPLEDYSTLYRELDESNDRAFAILCGAFLDEKLKAVLLSFLASGTPQIEKTRKNLFLQDGPLGSFASKMKLAYCLGLLSTSEFHDLNSIRDIRNTFAHNLHGLSFANSAIRDKCKALQLGGTHSHFDSLETRAQFRWSFVLLISQLSGREVEAGDGIIKRVLLPDKETSEERFKRWFG